MIISKPKILIASTGEETRILYHGIELPGGNSLTFSVDGDTMPEVTLEIEGVPWGDNIRSEKEFFASVERMLGYRITNVQSDNAAKAEEKIREIVRDESGKGYCLVAQIDRERLSAEAIEKATKNTKNPCESAAEQKQGMSRTQLLSSASEIKVTDDLDKLFELLQTGEWVLVDAYSKSPINWIAIRISDLPKKE